MKTLTRLNLIAITIVFFLASAAVAEASLYIGLKAGVMASDISALDDATNGGLLVGYSFGPFALEAEYTGPISEGDIQGFSSGEWDVDTLALYAVVRTPGPIYFKGKLGVLNEDAKVSLSSISGPGSDTGASIGAGLGVSIPLIGNIEAEYTIIEEDFNFISIGFNYNF